MGAHPTPRESRRRVLSAAAAVLLAHAALFGYMATVHPGVMAPPPDERQAVELQLLPPLTASAHLPPSEALPRAARALTTVQSPLQGLAAPTAPVVVANGAPPSPPQPPSAAYPGFFEGGLPGCGLEDIALLTAEEKARCRNQIEVARARRKQADDDAERAARMAAVRALPRVDGIPPLKRAYYDAVVAAQDAVKGDFTQKDLVAAQSNRGLGLAGEHKHVDVNIGVHCSTRGQIAHLGFKLGPFTCPLDPPPGFLTEEARVKPP